MDQATGPVLTPEVRAHIRAEMARAPRLSPERLEDLRRLLARRPQEQGSVAA